VILQALTLKDVGAYAGEQQLQFAPPSPEAPITLIGGLNGSGKTTLLWAILHALYGPLALPMVRRKGRYDSFLRERMHRDATLSSVTLDVSLPLAGEMRACSVRRQWEHRGDRVQESVLVEVDGVHDPMLSAAWPDAIESILPRSVARLFFFDGEKVEALADLERAKDTLRVAVGSLLGLDIVDQLMTDLKALRARETSAVAAPSDRAELDKLSEDVSRAKHEIAVSQSALTERARAKQSTRKKLDEVNRQFEAAGGPIYEEQAALRESRRAAQERLQWAQAEARELVADWAPMLLVREQLNALRVAIQDERTTQQAAELHQLLERRDRELLAWVKELGADASLRRGLGQRLAKDRKSHELVGRRSLELRAEEACASQVTHLAHGGLDQLAEGLGRALRAIEEATLEIEEAERLIARVPDALGIEAIAAERDSLELELAQATGAWQAADEDLERLRRELAKREARRERHLEKLAEKEGDQDDRRRVVKHASRASETLLSLRERAVERHLGRIEQAIGESLEELLRKESLVGGLSIDPATFDLRLHSPDGKPLPTDRLSAGERQLVAQAMLWGLSRAAQRPIPAVIDTPLSRLDADHRSHIVERYLPRASHQVVVLSTDTELVEEHRQLLGGCVGREYTLAFDDRLGNTTIVPGYFTFAAA
jgi:DNA sulfur modification protein DndD